MKMIIIERGGGKEERKQGKGKGEHTLSHVSPMYLNSLQYQHLIINYYFCPFLLFALLNNAFSFILLFFAATNTTSDGVSRMPFSP